MKNMIKITHILLITSCLINIGTAQAQQNQSVLNGLVLQLLTDEPMSFVEITNLNSGKKTHTGEEGQFSISAQQNDLVEFYYPGFRTDTLMVIEFALKRVYLTPAGESIQLDAVEIEALTDRQLEAEIDRAKKEGQVTETSQQRGGIRISPSRLFGESGRKARARYEMLLEEQTKRVVDRRFKVSAIQAVTPLKELDLQKFMTKFRPTVEFAQSASEEVFKLYIMDSYAEFKKLSPSQKAAIQIPKKN